MGILFAVFSPAIFAINNYIDKFLLEKHNLSPTVISIWGGIVSLIVGCIILVLTGFYSVDLRSMLIILSSGFLTTIYLLPYYKALSLDETSYVAPLFNLYPIFVLLLSFLLLRENFNSMMYLGSFIIIISGIFLSIEKSITTVFKLRSSFFYMLLSCLIFAVAQILYKFGLKEIPFLASLPYEGFGIAIGALCVTLYKGNLKHFLKSTKKFKKSTYAAIGVNELVYLIARYTGYFAMSLISVSLVSIISGFQPLFVLLYGIVLSFWFPKILKEVINKGVLFQKIFCILLMLVGLVLIFK